MYWLSYLIPIFVFLCTVGVVITCLVFVGGAVLPDLYLMHTALYSITQAIISALLSVLLGAICACILNRYSFFKGRIFQSFLYLPIVFPVLAAVMGLLTIWGRDGIIYTYISSLFDMEIKIFGTIGIILTNILFNIPLVIKVLMSRMSNIPASSWLLAYSLGFSRIEEWKHVEYPAIRGALIQIFILICLFCLANFSVVILIGDGFRSSTLEVVTYNSFLMDFRPRYGMSASLLQIILCIIVSICIFILQGTRQLANMTTCEEYSFHDRNNVYWLIIIPICILTIFVFLPVLVFVKEGISGILNLSMWHIDTLRALGNSIVIGVASGVLNLIFLLPVMVCVRNRKTGAYTRNIVSICMYTPIIISPVIIASALIILLNQWIDIDKWGMVIVIIINSITMLPVSFSVMLPAVNTLIDYWFPVIEFVDTSIIGRTINLYIPLLRKQLILSFGLVAGFSMSDITVFLILGSNVYPTLPMAVYNNLSAYRYDLAFGSALLLAVVSGLVCLLIDNMGEKKDSA